jgi:hypothetical protein
MQGNKTHEQFQRSLERKDDMRKVTEMQGRVRPDGRLPSHLPHAPDARQSEFAVSFEGMNQESRDHHKHNHQTQSGHGPQKHKPAEEKH